MNVVVNGSVRELGESATLSEAVRLAGSTGAGVAAAVNNEVVARTDWDLTRLADGDEVEVLTAVQGG